jgi:hypothetical protein
MERSIENMKNAKLWPRLDPEYLVVIREHLPR